MFLIISLSTAFRSLYIHIAVIFTRDIFPTESFSNLKIHAVFFNDLYYNTEPSLI